MNFVIDKNWNELLKNELESFEFLQFKEWLHNEYKTKTIYPKFEDIFNAINMVSLNNVKVVIIGQDPYHQPNQAHGLSFSVKNNKLPPSLKNIFKEINLSVGGNLRENGDLTDWAEQGVLLLNSVLTVEQSKPGSHAKGQWQNITKAILQIVNKHCSGVVFMLWGNYAKKYENLVDKNKHFVLTATHPSPLGANKGGWFGCNCFNDANKLLVGAGKKPINWV